MPELQDIFKSIHLDSMSPAQAKASLPGKKVVSIADSFALFPLPCFEVLKVLILLCPL